MSNSSTTCNQVPQIQCRGVVVEYQMQRYRSATFKDKVINSLKGRTGTDVHRALKGVDIDIMRGEFVAILGHNGSGKSTLLKVLSGILPPSKGTVETKGVCVPLIELGAGFDSELTGRENIFLNLGLLGLSRKEIQTKIPEIEDFSELGQFLDMPIKTYSSGMHMRLGFACSVCINADVLLIDEILAVGDENFQKKCIKRMLEIRALGTTMILVSHDASYAQQMADKVIVLDEGSKVYDGGATHGVHFYHELMHQKAEEAKPEHIRAEGIRKKSLISNDASSPIGHEARLRKALVYSKDGNSVMYPEEDGVLSIEFEVIREFAENPCIGFAIHTNDGQNLRIFGGNTRVLGREADQSDFRKPGIYTALFNLEFLNLAAGSYRLITAIHSNTLDRTIDLNTFALEFEISSVDDPHNFDKDLISVHSLIKQVEVKNVSLH